MTYIDLIQNKLLFLPISSGSHTFKTGLLQRLHAYLNALQTIEDGSLGIENLPDITGKYVKNVHAGLVDALVNVIEDYLYGKPGAAYRRLDETLKNELKDFTQILKIRRYDTGESFFRMRIKKGNIPFTPDEMFHVPFHSRGTVSTQRFSIPGFPCLYLGRTLYGCWEELNRPDVNEFQAVRLESVREITYLDLTRPVNMNNIMSKDIFDYLMTWPIIACCSVKVKEPAHTFKPEYIIPQLLLQWVRENNEVDGIRFDSTHIDFHESKSIGDFSNLVMPVKTSYDDGYCLILRSYFASTMTISWQLYQYAAGGQIFLMPRQDKVNTRIEKLELVNGKSYPYSYSILGRLENYLDQMDTFSLHDRS